MTDRRSVILIGLRGSGKSTIGPLLADRLGLPFVDLDPLTLRCARAGDVSQIVEQGGWEAFRSFERDALRDVLRGEACVLALGGGTPTDAGSRALLDASANAGTHSFVYLRARPESLAARMQATGNRPSLTGADPFAEISALFEARDPLYLELAHAVVETDTLTLDQTVSAAIHAV